MRKIDHGCDLFVRRFAQMHSRNECSPSSCQDLVVATRAAFADSSGIYYLPTSRNAAFGPLDGVADEGGAVGEAELLLDVGAVGFYGAGADAEGLGDVLAGFAGADEF